MLSFHLVNGKFELCEIVGKLQDNQENVAFDDLQSYWWCKNHMCVVEKVFRTKKEE